jgi:acetyl esterase
MREFDGGLFFPPREHVLATYSDYVSDPARHGDPRADFIAADPALIPPLYLAAAGLDTLRDSSANLARRLAAAGRPHRHKIYPGMVHSFFGYTRTVEGAQEAVRDIAAFLREQVPVG